MWSTAREIVAGDLVIVWMTREAVQPLLITPGKEFNGKFGVYRHSDLVGIPYGSKVGSRNGNGFIHVLRPTPELWTLALPHRTQILYFADIAFVVSYLNIKPGSQVVEAGTGSGSFSHSVARTIGPSGNLYSYEFHETRASKARAEFHSHGLSNIITITHRNVCKDGFTITDQADSVFLDLPAPWDAVQHAKRALRKDRTTRICCFSPCMEQVLRTVTALNEAGFTDITMYETLLRPHEVHTPLALAPIGEVSERLKQSEARREDKRLKQIAASQVKRGGKKRKRGSQETEGSSEQDMQDSRAEPKKLRAENEGAGEAGHGHDDRSVTRESVPPATAIASASVEARASSLPKDAKKPTATPVSAEALVIQEPPPASPTFSPTDLKKMVVSRVINEVRGHTSYLTFAVLLPIVLPHGSRESFVDYTLVENVGETKDTLTTDMSSNSPSTGWK